MGWSNGTELMRKIIVACNAAVPNFPRRKALYQKIIEAMQEQDWDCEYECKGQDPAYDSALKAVWKKQGVVVEGDE